MLTTPLYSGAVTVVFVTGMSGTGKSTALAELARRGYRVVDTDYGAYAEEVPADDARGHEQLWREERIEALLDGHEEGVLFISGCVSNQTKFYPRFDAVVLLSAPADVILERVAVEERTRSANAMPSGIESSTIWHALSPCSARVQRLKSIRDRRWTRWSMRSRPSRSPTTEGLRSE